MKKLALVLGALLVVGSVASAAKDKEVKPRPKEVTPEVKIIKEKEIVYVDRPVPVTTTRATSSKAKGFFKTTFDVNDAYNYEYNTKPGAGAGKTKVVLGIKNEAKINFTDNDSFKITTKHSHGISPIGSGKKDVKLNMDYEHDFGKLAGKIGTTAGLGYEHKVDENHITAEVEFDFADYLLGDTLNKLALTPNYDFEFYPEFAGAARIPESHTVGLGLDAGFVFPYGIKFSFGADDLIKHTIGSKELVTSPFVKLSKGFGLVSSGAHTLNLDASLKTKSEIAFLLGKNTFVTEGINTEIKPVLKYNFKVNDTADLFANVGAKGEVDYQMRTNAGNVVKAFGKDNSVGTKGNIKLSVGPVVEAGFKLSF